MKSAPYCYAINGLDRSGCPTPAVQQKIVQALNATHTWVWNVSGLQLLQPLQANICPARDFAAVDRLRIAQQLQCSVKKGGVHGHIIGNILPNSQPVEIYRTGNSLPERVTSLWDMPKDDENPIAALATNVHRIKKTEMEISNAEVAARAKKAGHKTTAKTVSNVEAERHSVGIGKIVAIAAALEVPTWQLFLKEAPESPHDRAALHKLVLAFLQLKDRGRATLLADADLLLLRKDKLDDLNQEAIRGRTDREDLKSNRA